MANSNEAVAVQAIDQRKMRFAPIRSANSEKITREKAKPMWNPLEIDPAAAADIPHSLCSTGRTAAYVIKTR
jgi:hypothetical protein